MATSPKKRSTEKGVEYDSLKALVRSDLTPGTHAKLRVNGTQYAVISGDDSLFEGRTVPTSLLSVQRHYRVSKGEVSQEEDGPLNFDLSESNPVVVIDLVYPGDDGLCPPLSMMELGVIVSPDRDSSGEGTFVDLRAMRHKKERFVAGSLQKGGNGWGVNVRIRNSDHVSGGIAHYDFPTPVPVDSDTDGERRLRIEWVRNGAAYRTVRASWGQPDGSRTTHGIEEGSTYRVGGEGTRDKWTLRIHAEYQGSSDGVTGISIPNIGYRVSGFKAMDSVGTPLARPKHVFSSGPATWVKGAYVRVPGEKTLIASKVEPGFSLIGPGTILRAESSTLTDGVTKDTHPHRSLKTLQCTTDASKHVLTEVKKITFDGKSGGQHLEHAHMFQFGIYGDGSSKPRIHIDGCHFKNAPGDGLYLLCCDAIVENCTAEGSGRADISVTHSTNLIFRNNRMGINHETEDAGLYPSKVRYEDCEVWSAQVAASGPGGTLHMERVHMDRTVKPESTGYNVQLEGGSPAGWFGSSPEHKVSLRSAIQVPTYGIAVDCDWTQATHVTIFMPGTGITLRNVKLPSEHVEIAGDCCLFIRVQDRWRHWRNQSVVLEDLHLPKPVALWGNCRILLNNVTGPAEGPWIVFTQLLHNQGLYEEQVEIIHNGISYTFRDSDGEWRP